MVFFSLHLFIENIFLFWVANYHLVYFDLFIYLIEYNFNSTNNKKWNERFGLSQQMQFLTVS